MSTATFDSVPVDSNDRTQSASTLFDAVYARLKAMAGRQLAHRERGSLDTTALVHELYVRVCAQREIEFAHPAQFFQYAAKAMRHLLNDRARDHLRQRAGGDWYRVSLGGAEQLRPVADAEQALALDAALRKLEDQHERASQVVELRYFAGLSLQQIATMMRLNRRTVDRDWRFARAFLHDQL